MPAATAPAPTTLVAAPPVNGFGLLVPVGEVTVVLLPEPLVRVKLAHVRRVVLLVWMLMERLPRKEPRPL